MAPLILPGRGYFNAAGSTTTASAPAEDANAPVVPGAPHNTVAPVEDGAADRTIDDLFEGDVDDLFEGDVDDLFDGEVDDLFAENDDNGASPPASPARSAGSPAAHVPAPAGAAVDNTPAPATPQQQITPAEDTPAEDAPAKRPRGRPPGKAPPKAPVTYRCRYGCTGAGKGEHGTFTGGVALRKHMMRVHCVFSSAHQNLQNCPGCTRLIDTGVKELICNKRKGLRDCPKLTDAEKAKFNVLWPRDAQEEADTFAYSNSGPDGKGPSALVVVHPGDDEAERRQACADAIKSWRPDASADAARFSNGLMTPGETPFQQSFIDLTGDGEDIPAQPVFTYEGKGKKRAADAAFIDLAGDDEQVPTPPSPAYEGKGKKRAIDVFQAGADPAAGGAGFAYGPNPIGVPDLANSAVPYAPGMDAAAETQHFDSVFNEFHNDFPDFDLVGAEGGEFEFAEGAFDFANEFAMGGFNAMA